MKTILLIFLMVATAVSAAHAAELTANTPLNRQRLEEYSTEYKQFKAGKKLAEVSYTIQANGLMKMSADLKSLWPEDKKLTVEGKITHYGSGGMLSGTTKLSGILLDDTRDIFASWLYSTNSITAPTDITNVLKKLKKPIRTGETGANVSLPSPIWLFKMDSSGDLTFQP